MEAFLMAAGLGTRLLPLTQERPKALVEVAGKTLLQRSIEYLSAQGVEHIVVNVHHHARMLTEYITANHWEPRISISDESALLLDTGGALRRAASLFDGQEPIVVYNVDVLAAFPLAPMLQCHLAHRNIATLAVSPRHTQRRLLFAHHQLVGHHNGTTGIYQWVAGHEPADGSAPEDDIKALAFSGIAIVEPQLPLLLPPTPPPYPIIPEYLRLAATHPIGCYLHDPSLWLDVGKPDTLSQAATFLDEHPHVNTIL